MSDTTPGIEVPDALLYIFQVKHKAHSIVIKSKKMWVYIWVHDTVRK